jgi:phosphomannomutase
VDRAGCVDASGAEINRNRLVALASVLALEGQENGIVVTDSVTSDGLKKFIETNLGGEHYRYKRGYRNVINESIRLNNLGQDSQLAIETSGHGALKENYFLDDGAYLVTKLLIELAKGKKQGYSLESLIASLEEPAESIEFRMNILVDDFKTYGQQVIDALSNYASKQPGWTLADDNHEGIRVNLDDAHGDGWFLLRLSLHDPLLPLNIESNRIGGAKQIASELANFLTGYDQLDTTSICSYTK